MIKHEREATFDHFEAGTRKTGLKKDENGRLAHDENGDLVWNSVEYDAGWNLFNRDKHVRVFEEAQGHELMELSKSAPQLIVDSGDRVWWLYNGNVFSTKEDLDSDEVLALIEEKENKKKIKIARAKAVAAMAGGLDQQGKRQPIGRDVKVAVWQRDQGRCVQCGNQGNLEYDHIIPHSKGGADTERNLQLLCANCNREKGSSL